ncbi:hypothetical protein 1 [Hubei sobemo-like virus 3]|uniref:hypothetical protein 1 n=1 Tax=Hubei sobemo-like virus 3 TaxID=1923216 RepID=UPI00090C5864|nr:hypothetical protein 1 [Hubei sobemo-like virus 3]APG75907.1 hypothetical protein 1 [Hubei sobemo-like virus 3]
MTIVFLALCGGTFAGASAVGDKIARLESVTTPSSCSAPPKTVQHSLPEVTTRFAAPIAKLEPRPNHTRTVKQAKHAVKESTANASSGFKTRPSSRPTTVGKASWVVETAIAVAPYAESFLTFVSNVFPMCYSIVAALWSASTSRSWWVYQVIAYGPEAVLIGSAIIAAWGSLTTVAVVFQLLGTYYKFLNTAWYNLWWYSASLPFAVWNFATLGKIRVKYPAYKQGVEAIVDGDTVKLMAGGKIIQVIKLDTKDVKKEMAFASSTPSRFYNKNDPRFRSQVVLYRKEGDMYTFVGDGTYTELRGRVDGLSRKLIFTCAHVSDLATHFSAANSHETPQQRFCPLPDPLIRSNYKSKDDTDVAIYEITASDVSKASALLLPSLLPAKACDLQGTWILEGDELFAGGFINPITKEPGYWRTHGPAVSAPVENPLIGGHMCSTTEGWSGTGLFVSRGGQWFLGGIHTGSVGDRNTFVLVEEMVDHLQEEWAEKAMRTDCVREKAYTSKNRKFGHEGRQGEEAKSHRASRAQFIAGTGSYGKYGDGKEAAVAVTKEAVSESKVKAQVELLAKLKAEHCDKKAAQLKANALIPKVNENDPGFQRPPERPVGGRTEAATSTEKQITQKLSELTKAITKLQATAVAVTPKEVKQAPTQVSSPSSTNSSQGSQENSSSPPSTKEACSSQSTTTTTAPSTEESEWKETTSKNAQRKLRKCTKLQESLGISHSDLMKLSPKILKMLTKATSATSSPQAGQATPTASSETKTGKSSKATAQK